MYIYIYFQVLSNSAKAERAPQFMNINRCTIIKRKEAQCVRRQIKVESK